VQTVEHHAALQFAEISSFISKLKQQSGVAATCLEFTIQTATRTGESIGAQWDEIDLSNKIWTIPGERMKAARPHRIPLSHRAIEILEKMKQIQTNDFIFPGAKKGLSNMAMLQLLKRMGCDNLTVHGFRSTFRNWNEVVEMALAHTIKNMAEAAYRRGDLLEKRSQLMSDWAEFCNAKLES
jgi:integrase